MVFAAENSERDERTGLPIELIVKIKILRHVEFFDDHVSIVGEKKVEIWGKKMKTEVWKQYEDFSDYQFSNFGRVRSFKCGKETIRHYSDKNEYVPVTLSQNKIQKTKYLHIIIATLFLPNPKNKPEVDHIDGWKSNNNVANLKWVTHVENTSYGHNLHRKNEEETAKDIFILSHLSCFSDNNVARYYKVSSKNVNNIKNGWCWGHVTKEINLNDPEIRKYAIELEMKLQKIEPLNKYF